MKISVKIFFKNISIKGLKNLPLNRPVLLASNHINAFLDAIVLAVFVKQRLCFLARSDVFNTPLKRWLLGQLHIAPIYRIEEGAEHLHKNSDTFQKSYKLLKEKSTLLIFPEGTCVQERRIRKLRKGAARIAFGAEEFCEFNLNLCIVPVGINYSTPAQFGGDMFVNIAAPIEVSEYISSYKKDKAKTINQLTFDLENEMKKLVVVIENKADDEFVERVEKLFLEKINPEKDFFATQKLISNLNDFEKNDKENFDKWRTKTNHYFNEIKQLNLKDKFLKKEFSNWDIFKLIIPKIILIPIDFTWFLFGVFANYIPFKIPYLITKKVVKNVEFFSSVNLAIGTIIFSIYYSLQSLFFLFCFHNYIKIFLWISDINEMIGHVFFNLCYTLQTVLNYLFFSDIILAVLFVFAAKSAGFFALEYEYSWKEMKEIIKTKNNSKVKKLAEHRRELLNELNLQGF